MEPDLSKGDWIRIAKEWRLLDGSRPEPRLEGRCQYYGCETGCAGYQIYLVVDGKETPLADFYFLREEALGAAEDEANQRGLPLVMDRDWDC